MVEILLKKGLIRTKDIGKVYKNGLVEIFARPVTLPQGFTLSCAIFTKLTRQVVRMWRARSYRLAHILDDFLFACQCILTLIAMRCDILEDLRKLGLFVSWSKSILTPTQIIKWVGFVINTILMKIFVPGEKVIKFETAVTNFKEDLAIQPTPHATFRTMASIVGKLISFVPAMPAARMFSRETYACIRPKNHDFDATGPVTPEMVQQLTGAIKHIRPLNTKGAPIRRKAKMLSLRLMLDGSVDGFGYRLDGVTRDIKWGSSSTAVALEWTARPDEWQAWREN